LFEFLRASGFKLKTSKFRQAIRNENIEVIEWGLKQHLLQPTEFERDIGIAKRNKKIVELFRAAGVPWDEGCYSPAIYYGNLDMVQWLHAQGCPLNTEVIRQAATRNQFEILKWLRSQDCPWDYFTTFCAASSGNLDMLKWLRNQDPPCPMTFVAFLGATQEGHLEIAQWIYELELFRCDKRAALMLTKHEAVRAWLNTLE